MNIAVGEWPPYVSSKLLHYGVSSRIITEAFALEEITTGYTFFPWGRTLHLVKNNEYDATSMWNGNQAREQDYLVSAPIYEKQDAVFFHLKSFVFNWDPDHEDYANLKGKVVGATIGYQCGDEFAKAEQKKLIRVSRVPYEEVNFDMLLKGRIDVFIASYDTGYYALRANFTADQAALLTYTYRHSEKDSYHLLFSKKNPQNIERLKAFNRGLQELKENGKYDQYWQESDAGKYILNGIPPQVVEGRERREVQKQ